MRSVPYTRRRVRLVRAERRGAAGRRPAWGKTMLLGSPRCYWHTGTPRDTPCCRRQKHWTTVGSPAPADAAEGGGSPRKKIKRRPPAPQGLPLRPALAVPRTIYRLDASSSDVGRHRTHQLLEPAAIASTSRRLGLGSAFLADAASAILHSCFTSAAYSEDEGRRCVERGTGSRRHGRKDGRGLAPPEQRQQQSPTTASNQLLLHWLLHPGTSQERWIG